MVKERSVAIFLFIFLFLATSLFSEEIKVVSEIDANTAYANQPINGIITITHSSSSKIDTSSFVLDHEPLNVTFARDVPISPHDSLIISIYNFQLPGKSPGLYVLPSISVVIDGKKYQSPMSSYSVEKGTQRPNLNDKPQQAQQNVPIKTKTTVEPPFLKLEASIEGKTSLYPGQRTKLVYHYFFRGNIELTHENLPLIDAKGLIKIGEKEIKSLTEDDISASEISQQVEANQPGEYSFGPSLIEGYAYEEDSLGKRIHTSEKLSSEAPPVTITVLPFPEQGKPTSFNGAVGKEFQLKVSLLTPTETHVGSEIQLSIDITGTGNIKSVPLPEVCCQPGFSGFFRTSDLPPPENVHENTKTAIVRLYPLSENIKQIPSLEFSYFDPDTATYKSLRSSPIAISVDKASKPSETKETPTELPAAPSQPSSSIQEKTHVEPIKSKIYTPTSIEIEGIYSLTNADLRDKILGTWWALAAIPLWVALLIYQDNLRYLLLKKKGLQHTLSSQTLMEKAFAELDGSAAFFEKMNKALKTALFEVHLISSASIDDEDLPVDGVAGEVRQFILDISERRFATHAKFDYQSIRKHAQALMDKIINLTKTGSNL